MSKGKISRPVLGHFLFFVLIAILLAGCGGGAVVSSPTPGSDETDIPDTLAVTETPAGETGVSTETITPTVAPSSSGAVVSFSKDVLPIFNSRCAQCHGRDATRGGLSLSSYASLMSGSDNGPVIIPGDVENSVLLQLVKDGTMPKRGPDLFPEQIQILMDWVSAGALDN